MNKPVNFDELEVGFDVPAVPGMNEADIQTPCLVLDLDALERNIKKMGDYAMAHGMRHRAHGKMHKSVDVLKLQQEMGAACGVCCQKVSEAEVFVRGGIKDVMVSNQVTDPFKIDRLAQLPKHGARILVCADDPENIKALSDAAQKHGTQLAPTSGSMGYGFPAAVSASLQYPDRTVVCLAGDGCFQMTCNELSTAVQHGAKPIVIVMNNGRYGTIRMHQEKNYPGRVSGTDLFNPDYAALAQAYGGTGHVIAENAQFAGAYTAALKGGLHIIDLKLDPKMLATSKNL